jgi:hypothetical protein
MRDFSQLVARSVFVLGVLAAVGVRAADGCTCLMASCGDLARADAVFEATVASIEPSPGVVSTGNAASATFINGGGMRLVRLKDVRGWRGEAPNVVYTGQGGGDCGYDFRAGERYLIEASRSSDGRFSTGICSLIREIKYAAPLIEYLKALKQSPAQTRVMGTVTRVTGWAPYENALTPITGAQVTLRGPKQVTMATDGRGNFLATGLPEGMYDVIVQVDGKAVAPEPQWSQFLLGRDGMKCEELSIQVPATGGVKGQVIGRVGG